MGWRPGESGNVKGRPVGSRNKLTERFFEDLYSAWKEKGVEVIHRLIEHEPGTFFRGVVAVLPKEHRVTRANDLVNLTDDQLTKMLETLREKIRDREQLESVDVTRLQ
jgi:hypothetical protein